MARSHDDGGDGREATKALSGEEGRETGLGKTDKKRKRMGAEAPPPPPAPSQEDHRATSSADDGLDYARAIVDKSVREILAIKANRVPSTELCKKYLRLSKISFLF
jgi:hypothetical protein